MSNLLSLREASPILRSCETTLRRMARRGELPCRKFGKRYFLSQDDINKFLNDKKYNWEGDKNENTN
jgi:excisionase family DNA binding protein